MPVRHIIIGSGIAAISAAESIRSVDEHARITMISAEPYPFYYRPALARLLSGEISESLLAVRSAEQVEALSLERLATHVRALDPVRHEVTLGDGSTLVYDRLLIATGAATIPADIEGATLKGVVQLDGVRDANRMLELVRNAKAAVVMGGGSTALEIAEGLNARGLATHYTMRGGRYWQRVLDDVESGLVEARLALLGIQLHRQTSLARAVGVEGRLVAVETTDGVRIECDVLAVASGVRPRVEIAAGAGLMVDRGVLTDEYLETTAPDVFAAGDVAQVPDETGGRGRLDTLWASAEVQGRSAGLNMAGAKRRHVKHTAVNVTRLAGIATTIAGAVGGASDPDLVTLTRGQSERWDAPVGSTSVSGHRGDDRLRLVLQDTVLIGVLAMGVESVRRPLTNLIGRRVDQATMRHAEVAQPDAALDILTNYCNTMLGSGGVGA